MPFSWIRRLTAGALAALLAGVTGCAPANTNNAPVANAGPDQVSRVHREPGPTGALIDVFDPVTLDGSGSIDPDGDHLSRYFWAFDTIPVGSHLDFSALAPNTSSNTQTSFTPDIEGTYGLTLQVFDGQLLSSLDYVEVTVVRENSAPVADAGADLNGVVGSYATFDGTSSIDAENDLLAFRWRLEVLPPGSHLSQADLVYPATPNPRLSPDVPGVYALSLVVSDGVLESDPDFVTLTVTSGNQSPVVDAGPSRSITPCQPSPIVLDGSGSFDPEGDAFSYQWSVLETPYGSSVKGSSLSDPTAAVTTVALDLYGLYVFGLTLDDGLSAPSQGTVAILFDDGSSQAPPVADAGGDQSARASSSCTAEGCAPCIVSLGLDGSASFDPNSDPLTYQWSVISGDAQLTEAGSSTPLLIGPALTPPKAGLSVSTTVKVQLVVADCAGSSSPSVASITFICDGT